jgi:hypothetical protein
VEQYSFNLLLQDKILILTLEVNGIENNVPLGDRLLFLYLIGQHSPHPNFFSG